MKPDMLHNSLHHLRDCFRTYVEDWATDITAFCGDALNTPHTETQITPVGNTITDQLSLLQGLASPETLPIMQAIQLAAPHVTWRQSYTTQDKGFDAHFLAHYAWFNLIAPSGPFVSHDMRLSIGYWGQGLTYPWHWHAPAEIYLVLAGGAIFEADGRDPIDAHAGQRIAHIPNQPHAAQMDHGPLLAAAFWTGENLEGKSSFPKDIP